MANSRSITEINELVAKGDAVVLTVQEISDIVKGGEDLTIKDVDVVTTATRAIMSGTYVVLSFPISEPCSFIRANRVWINGVPTSIGPCPNERLGIIDLMVFGTSHSKENSNYGGGHLLRDLVEGKEVLVETETDIGKSFKNYVTFVNPKNAPLPTIFSALDFPPNLACATVSGCGQLNPIKNDPNLETIGIGTRILINGAQGFVIGTGTRSMASRPNLMGLADMHQMNPECMGGFVTSAGPECIGSWAVPIPVLNESILESIKKLDRDMPLPIMDVNMRQTICKTSYGDIWDEADLETKFDPSKCINCEICTAELVCPMRAIAFEGDQVKRDNEWCFYCGLCATQCVGGAFQGSLGAINFDG